jgi:hypothetical protein
MVERCVVRVWSAMSPGRWKSISPSQYAWEAEALEVLRQGLPDQ